VATDPTPTGAHRGNQAMMGGNYLAGRRVVLIVGGGIAAYKAVEVCRRMVDAGAHVSCVMTEGARRFVGEVTFSALASEPVRSSMWDDADPIPHTTLGQGADVVVVAPATARLIGSYAAGISDDLATATLLATRAPVVVCPAMHTEMWEHPAVQENLATLARRGVAIVPPEEGRLAGGDVGAGRLADPATILAAAERAVSPGDLAGVRVLVTAGGTSEQVDAVRTLTNRSSGRQGYAVATEAAARGADVVLVSAAALPPPPLVGTVISVATAADMLTEVLRLAPSAQVVVMAAAVADFRPVDPPAGKVKKRDGIPVVELEETADILAELGRQRHDSQVLVGFAAETDDVVAAATAKLAEKNVDFMVANDVSAPGAGFAGDTNVVTIVSATAEPEALPLRSKRSVAAALWDRVVARLTR